jgi:hypothetical protein
MIMANSRLDMRTPVLVSTAAKLHPSLSRPTSSTSKNLPSSNRIDGRVASGSGGVHSRLEGDTSEWEDEWRRDKFNSRRASEDDEVETLARPNEDRGNGSQRSTVKTRLSLPGLWNVNGSMDV